MQSAVIMCMYHITPAYVTKLVIIECMLNGDIFLNCMKSTSFILSRLALCQRDVPKEFLRHRARVLYNFLQKNPGDSDLLRMFAVLYAIDVFH